MTDTPDHRVAHRPSIAVGRSIGEDEKWTPEVGDRVFINLLEAKGSVLCVGSKALFVRLDDGQECALPESAFSQLVPWSPAVGDYVSVRMSHDRWRVVAMGNRLAVVARNGDNGETTVPIATLRPWGEDE